MPDFRIGIARFWHESNSFSCALTTVEDFNAYHHGTLLGQDIPKHLDQRDEIVGIIGALDDHPAATPVPLLSAGALPSGLITEDTVQHFESTLRGQLQRAAPLDAVCLALHGAISSVPFPDFDGHILRVVRDEVGPHIPITCALDCHAVVTNQMFDLSTAMTAYRTHPHVDEVETGRRAAHILLDILDNKINPTAARQRIPLLLPPPDDGTHSGALKEIFDAVIDANQIDNVVDCSLCPSYAWQDVPDQGWTVWAVTDDDPDLAQQLVRTISQQAWDARRRLLPEPMLAPQDAVRQAAATEGCPVVIVDTADVIGGGADGDTTGLLQALIDLRHEFEGLILCHIPDPEAVAQIKSHQLGDTVTVTIGGKRDRRYTQPIEVTGQINCITPGPITDDGQFGSEPMVETGDIVCLAVDNLRLVLTERVVMGPQPSLFRKVGVEPFEAKLVTLKTGVGFKKTYGHVAAAVIRANCPGASSYDLTRYDFQHIPRTIFPLDMNADWRPQPPAFHNPHWRSTSSPNSSQPSADIAIGRTSRTFAIAASGPSPALRQR